MRLHAAGVQPTHCLIVRGSRALVVRRWSPDTRLNGRTFHDAELVAGDRLSIGPIEFEVLQVSLAAQRQADPPDWTPPPPPEPAYSEDSTESRRPQPFDGRRQRSADHDRRRARRLIGQLRSARQGLADMEARHEQANQEHGRQLAELRQELANLRGAYDEEKRRWEAERAELDTRSQSFQQQWESRRAEAESRLADQRNALDARADQIEAREEEFRRRAEQLEAEREQLGKKTKQLEAQAEQLDSRSRELEAQAEQLQELADRLESLGEGLEADRAELEARLAEAEPERQDPTSDAVGGELCRERPEEIRFEEVSPHAPQSTTEILQRLGTMPLLPDDDDQEEVAAEQQGEPEDAPETAKSKPVGFALIAHDEKPANSPGSDEEDSIDQYMARLLDRVRGGGSGLPAPEGAVTMPIAPGPPAPPESMAESMADPNDAAEEPAAPQAEAKEKPQAAELSPRAAAPEKMVDLSAMRELANFSARQAIDRYSRRMLSRALFGKLSISAVSLLAGGVLMWFWWRDRSNQLAVYAAATSFVVSVFWVVQHFVQSRRVLATSRPAGKGRRPEAGGEGAD